MYITKWIAYTNKLCLYQHTSICKERGCVKIQNFGTVSFCLSREVLINCKIVKIRFFTEYSIFRG